MSKFSALKTLAPFKRGQEQLKGFVSGSQGLTESWLLSFTTFLILISLIFKRVSEIRANSLSKNFNSMLRRNKLNALDDYDNRKESHERALGSERHTLLNNAYSSGCGLGHVIWTGKEFWVHWVPSETNRVESIRGLGAR